VRNCLRLLRRPAIKLKSLLTVNNSNNCQDAYQQQSHAKTLSEGGPTMADQ
jgi:hypothetical protein